MSQELVPCRSAETRSLGSIVRQDYEPSVPLPQRGRVSLVHKGYGYGKVLMHFYTRTP